MNSLLSLEAPDKLVTEINKLMPQDNQFLSVIAKHITVTKPPSTEYRHFTAQTLFPGSFITIATAIDAIKGCGCKLRHVTTSDSTNTEIYVFDHNSDLLSGRK